MADVKKEEKKKAKITLTGLGRARYHYCSVMYYLDALEQVVEYYDQPQVRTVRATFKAEGSISETEYRDLCRLYHRYHSQLARVIGEDKYNGIVVEEGELAEEKIRLEQEASSEKEGNATIKYVEKLSK